MGLLWVFLKRLIYILVIVVFVAAISCEAPEKEKAEKKREVEPLVGISKPQEKVTDESKATGSQKESVESKEETTITGKHSGEPASGAASKTVKGVPVRLRFETHGNEIIEPIRIILDDKQLGATEQLQIDIKVPSEGINQPLTVEAPFFKQRQITVNEETREKQVDLEPLMAQIQLRDSLEHYPDQVNNVQIFYKDRLLGKSDEDGLAYISIPRIGSNRLACYKPGYFGKQYFTLHVNDLEKLYTVSLLPIKHFINLKVVDDENRPLKFKRIELVGTGQSGLALSGTTNDRGLVTLKHFKMVSGSDYTLAVPEFDFKQSNFEIKPEYLDASGKVLIFNVPLKYRWTIEADISAAQLALYDVKGERIAEGRGSIDISLPRGVFKIVASLRENTKEERFKSSDWPHRKVVILEDPYLYAKDFIAKNPNEELSDDLLNALWAMKASNVNFTKSRLLLGKLFLDREKYLSAARAYEEIFKADPAAKYDPSLLFLRAQSLMYFSENLSGSKKQQSLQRGLNEYLKPASAYLTRLPIESRKKWALKIKFLIGEYCQRLFFYHRKNDDFQLAKQYAGEAIDNFEEFIRDYDSLSASDELKKLLKNDYMRASDLIGSIRAVQNL